MSRTQNIFTRTQGSVDINSEIMSAILDNNLSRFRSLVNKTNVNDQINSNGDTCVILSCRLNRQQILTYLLNGLDAKFNIKNKENEDSFDVGTEKTKRILYDYKDKIQNLELDAIYDKLDSKTIELKNTKEELVYLKKNLDEIVLNDTTFKTRIRDLETERDELLTKCQKLLLSNEQLETNLKNEKRRATEAECAYLNLKKSKR
jgi:hypothetical protein